jgi:Kef-type K+ transport system membrane component KefB
MRGAGESATAAPRSDWLAWTERVPVEAVYVALLLALFVVPRALQRYKVPRAITSLAIGFGAGWLFPRAAHDPTLAQFSTLGIVALFLFAGLDVRVEDLRGHARLLFNHLAVALGVTALVAWACDLALGVDARAAILLALALLTPSAGFILESFDSLGASPGERAWIRTTVIASEILALVCLFATLRSDSFTSLAFATGVLVLLIALLPLAFRWFAAWIVPHAPRSEFGFLVVVAVTSALVTKHLGVYYLVGAFVVGMAAQRFRSRLPALASEKMLHAVEAFASLFVPFYFFHAGAAVSPRHIGVGAIAVGAAFAALAIPLRWLLVAGLRRLVLGEAWSRGVRIGVAMTPTLVFTLVLADILRQRFGVAPEVFGGLVLYAVVSTMTPTWLFKAAPPEFDAPQAPEIALKGTSAADDEGSRA